MEFKNPYVLAMRDQAPRMLRELVKTGRIEIHLQKKSEEAHALLDEILKHNPNPSLPEKRAAEEQVRALLIQFPPESRKRSRAEQADEEMPEPPEDLPLPEGGEGRTPRSKGPTTISSRGR